LQFEIIYRKKTKTKILFTRKKREKFGDSGKINLFLLLDSLELLRKIFPSIETKEERS